MHARSGYLDLNNRTLLQLNLQ